MLAVNTAQLAIWGTRAAKVAGKTKLGRQTKVQISRLPDTNHIQAVRSTKVCKAVEKKFSQVANTVSKQFSDDKLKKNNK